MKVAVASERPQDVASAGSAQPQDGSDEVEPRGTMIGILKEGGESVDVSRAGRAGKSGGKPVLLVGSAGLQEESAKAFPVDSGRRDGQSACHSLHHPIGVPASFQMRDEYRKGCCVGLGSVDEIPGAVHVDSDRAEIGHDRLLGLSPHSELRLTLGVACSLVGEEDGVILDECP